MLLSAILDEFSFHCQYRNLSPRTIRNYTLQINYLLRFLQDEKNTVHIKDVKAFDTTFPSTITHIQADNHKVLFLLVLYCIQPPPHIP